MNSDNNKKLENLSTLVINAIKDLRAGGESLSVKSLKDAFMTNKEIAALVDEPRDGKGSASPPESDELEQLQREIGRITGQKNKLFRQVDELSSKSEDAEKMYRRILGQFAQLLRVDDTNKELYKSIDHFTATLKKTSGSGPAEEAFSKLKNIVCTETPVERDREAKKAGSFFSKLIKGEKKSPLNQAVAISNYYNQLRDTYRDVVNELKLILGEKYLQRLLNLGKMIETADSLETFDATRRDMLIIFQDYIGDVNTDREKAATYITQIIQRLIDVENFLLGSLESVQEAEDENSKFSTLLGTHLEGLKGKADISRTFEELKNTVELSVTSIMDAVKSKKNSDFQRKEKLDKRIESLQKNLGEMKGEVRAANERTTHLEHELMEDPLTGAFNRRAYDRRLEEEHQRFLRYKTVFSLLMFDVDHFKKFNDTYGHAVGDKCLQEIINRVKPVLRDNDFLARYGGEEFVILLPETEKNGGIEAAEKTRKAIEKIEFLHKGEKVQVTVSVGVAQIKTDDQDSKSLFNRADAALYDAKNSGRNKVAYK